MLGPSPRHPSLLIRFAIVAFTLLAMLQFLPRASGAEREFAIYVSNERDGTITEIDGTRLEVTRTFPVGKRPRGIHVAPDGRTLLVATSGSPRLAPGADRERAHSDAPDKAADGIAVVDLATQRVIRRLKVGSDPEQFAVSSDGKTVFVANEDESAASFWDVASGAAIARATVSDEPEGVALHPTRSEVWVTCEEAGNLFVLDRVTGREIARLPLGGRPRSLVFSRDGRLAYAPMETKSGVAVIDAVAYAIVSTIPLPAPAMPMGSAISADDNDLYVTTGRGNAVAFIDTRTRTVSALVPVGARAWGLALSPDGSRLFTANGASDDVSVVDVKARRELKRIKVGAGPWGVAVTGFVTEQVTR